MAKVTDGVGLSRNALTKRVVRTKAEEKALAKAQEAWELAVVEEGREELHRIVQFAYTWMCKYGCTLGFPLETEIVKVFLYDYDRANGGSGYFDD